MFDTTNFRSAKVGTFVNIYKHIALIRYHDNHIVNEWYRAFEKLPTGMIPVKMPRAGLAWPCL
jgi:hypothetical protein